MFAKAGELGAPVGFMCMKVSDLYRFTIIDVFLICDITNSICFVVDS